MNNDRNILFVLYLLLCKCIYTHAVLNNTIFYDVYSCCLSSEINLLINQMQQDTIIVFLNIEVYTNIIYDNIYIYIYIHIYRLYRTVKLKTLLD